MKNKKQSPFIVNILTVSLVLFMFSACAGARDDNAAEAAGTRYYVAVDGDDRDPGTISEPFASWQKGIDVAQAGDTVFIRGGTYYADPAINDRFGAYMNYKSGTADARICVFAYPGETPLLDASTLTNTARMNCGIYIKSSNYWHIKGLQVTGVSQQGRPAWVAGILVENGMGNIVERCTSFENEGIGIMIREESEDNLLLNCDAYSNYDPENDGNNADGFQVCFNEFRAGDPRENILRGCRSWLNSDDGYDLWDNEGRVVFDHCWAFTNGTHGGDGYGFKLGRTSGAREEGIYRRELWHCIGAENVKWNFNNSESDSRVKIYNCTAYGSERFSGFDLTQDLHIMTGEIKNCISYGNNYGDTFGDEILSEYNDWDLADVVVSDDDFVSLDVSLLLSERKADGSLPDTDYLKLAEGSDLIDAGTDVGLPFGGQAPDLGAQESGSAIGTAPDLAVDGKIRIFPNPSENRRINIDLGKVALMEQGVIDIYDGSGMLVFNMELADAPAPAGKMLTVDLPELGAGIYLLRYRDPVKDHCSKLVLRN